MNAFASDISSSFKSPSFDNEGDRSTKIRIRNLQKRFQTRSGAVDALMGINVDVREGEFFSILGPSGCGKTTLLRIVAGLETKSEGRIEVIRSADTRSRGPLGSMVFQEQSIFPWMNVRDNIAFGLKARGVDKSNRLRIADNFIEKVGLHGFGQVFPHQLSGGMKQRVSIARALANDPEILLMDEPFGALDEQTKLVLQEELLRIWEETRKTVIYVTHSIDEAILLSDRIMIMSPRPGQIKDIIDVTSIFKRPRHVDETKSSAEFGKLFARVWGSLRNEVSQNDSSRSL